MFWIMWRAAARLDIARRRGARICRPPPRPCPARLPLPPRAAVSRVGRAPAPRVRPLPRRPPPAAHAGGPAAPVSRVRSGRGAWPAAAWGLACGRAAARSAGPGGQQGPRGLAAASRARGRVVRADRPTGRRRRGRGARRRGRGAACCARWAARAAARRRGEHSGALRARPGALHCLHAHSGGRESRAVGASGRPIALGGAC
jgi:hypothetical protein